MLAYQNKLPSANRDAIIAKINGISDYLGISPHWLMAVINFETAGSFSPAIQNRISGATGLIQFMPNTANGLGTSIEELKNMSFERQLDFVKRYYAPYRSRMKSFTDLYLATFYPKAIGKDDNYILEPARIIAQQNPIFDPEKNGFVTVGAIKEVLIKRIPAQYAAYFSRTATGLSLGLVVVVGIGIYLFKKLNQ